MHAPNDDGATPARAAPQTEPNNHGDDTTPRPVVKGGGLLSFYDPRDVKRIQDHCDERRRGTVVCVWLALLRHACRKEVRALTFTRAKGSIASDAGFSTRATADALTALRAVGLLDWKEAAWTVRGTIKAPHVYTLKPTTDPLRGFMRKTPPTISTDCRTIVRQGTCALTAEILQRPIKGRKGDNKAQPGGSPAAPAHRPEAGAGAVVPPGKNEPRRARRW